MTRHHYEMVAKAIREEIEEFGSCSNVNAVAKSLAVAFSLDNPRFDRQRFLTACGVTS